VYFVTDIIKNIEPFESNDKPYFDNLESMVDTKLKLNSGAKAFVPQSNLKASAATWKPTPGSKESESEEKPKEAAPAEAVKKVDSEPPALKKEDAKPEPVKAEPAAAAPSKPVVSAWGRKPLDAVKSAPPKSLEQTTDRDSSGFQRERSHRNNNNRDRDNNRDNNNRDRDNNKEWRRQKSDSNNGNWSRGNKQAPNKKNDDNSNGGGWARGKSLPLELLSPGDGTTDSQKGVKRIRAEDLLALRLSYVAPPLAWEQEGDDQVGPPEACRWISETRVQEIDAAAKTSRIGGDTSQQTRRKKKEVETAPALEDCKPLEVNEDTRWKPSVLNKEAPSSQDSNDAILKQSLLILNKLSLTKFDKLSDAFIDTGIGNNEECLAGAIRLIVGKAQDEPHFAAMYAALCLKLSKTPMSFEPEGKRKVFKKMLLVECQKEFESDTETKIKNATEGEEDADEKELKAAMIKKHYLGHMRFIGELYKGDLISIKIMLFCLPALLEGEVGKKLESEEKQVGDNESPTIDEEKVECFAKLMTVIGYNLEQQSAALKVKSKPDTSVKLTECWTKVEKMVAKKSDVKISNRIKFMLQDLIEMRNNGWTTRREEESAKTIAQIHKEAAKEARNMKRSTSSSSIRRQHSSGDVRNIGRSNSRPQMDKDGFTEVAKPASGFGRSQSFNSFSRSSSQRQTSKPQDGTNRKSSASGGSFAAFNEKSATAPRRSMKKAGSVSSVSERSSSLPDVDEKKVAEPKVNYLIPKECGVKAKNYLKEYFVGGDAYDAVLSIHELIGVGSEGSVERGAKVIEQSVLMVMEMKSCDVDKMLTVLVRCFKEKKIELASIVTGLNDPLEFLSDIAIDAPLATPNLVTIISKFVMMDNGLPFSIFENSPDWFRTDGGAATVACKVLKEVGKDIHSEANLKIVSELMTESDKEKYPSANDLLASV